MVSHSYRNPWWLLCNFCRDRQRMTGFKRQIRQVTLPGTQARSHVVTGLLKKLQHQQIHSRVVVNFSLGERLSPKPPFSPFLPIPPTPSLPFLSSPKPLSLPPSPESGVSGGPPPRKNFEILACCRWAVADSGIIQMVCKCVTYKSLWWMLYELYRTLQHMVTFSWYHEHLVERRSPWEVFMGGRSPTTTSLQVYIIWYHICDCQMC